MQNDELDSQMGRWAGANWVGLAEAGLWIGLYLIFTVVMATGETNGIGLFGQSEGASLWAPLLLGGAVNAVIIYLHIFRAMPLLLTPGHRRRYVAALAVLLVAYLIGHLTYQLVLAATIEPHLRNVSPLDWTMENLVAAPAIFLLSALYKFARDWLAFGQARHSLQVAANELQGELRLIKEELQSRQAAPSSAAYLRFESNRERVQIPTDAIRYIKAAGNYVEIVTNKRTVTVYGSIKDLMERLPQDQFARIHRSYVVNLNQVSLIKGNELHIGEECLPIGPSHRAALLDLWRGDQDTRQGK